MKKSIGILAVIVVFLFSAKAQNEAAIKKPVKIYHTITINANGNDNEQSSFLQGVGIRYAAEFEPKKLVRIGAGSGLNVLNTSVNEYFIPLFLKTDLVLGKKKVLPTIGAEFGYGFRFGKTENIEKPKGGIYLQPQAGISWKLAKGLEFQTKIGYLFQKTSYTYPNWWWGWNSESKRKVNYQRWVINFGFRF